MSKTAVLIVGATGNTGKSIADALLASPELHVIASVRPASLQKPVVESFSSRGVEIRSVDLATATPEQLAELLRGVDVVVSTLDFDKLGLQYALIDAARKAGVKRFIPSDWSPACVKGVRRMHDQKLAIHQYILKSGLGYTFIDAGYWFALALPSVDATPLSEPSAYHWRQQVFGTGNVKCAVIHLADIGRFVVRILLDERTLNKYIFLYSEELTQNEVLALARRVSGKQIPDPLRVTEDEVKNLVKKTDPTRLGHGGARQGSEIEFAMWEYALSIWFRSDNITENAKKEEYGGALDARELYPDVKLKSMEDYAREVYSAALA